MRMHQNLIGDEQWTTVTLKKPSSKSKSKSSHATYATTTKPPSDADSLIGTNTEKTSLTDGKISPILKTSPPKAGGGAMTEILSRTSSSPVNARASFFHQ